MSDSTADESVTKSSDVRWQYTSTIGSMVLLVSLPLLVVGSAIGVLSFGDIGQSWFLLYMTAVLAALVYVFGEETLAAVKKFRE